MPFNVPHVEPLIDDEFAGEPSQRALQYVASRRQQGFPVVGVYCSYAPLELIKAMGATVAVLCAFSQKTIPKAESTLPGNLCPLIKSSYGFVITERHVREKGVPFLQIETDFSTNDSGPMRTRIEALLETIRQPGA